MTREVLHELVDRIPEEEIQQRLLKYLAASPGISYHALPRHRTMSQSPGQPRNVITQLAGILGQGK